jgi:large subunit ribosomal protein L3
MSYFWRPSIIRPSSLARARTQGKRFGPRGAQADGGKMFMYSSVDLARVIESKALTHEDVIRLYKEGVIFQWLKGKKYTRIRLWKDPKTGWKRGVSVRCGALAVKIGMKMEIDWWGRALPVTVLQIRDNHVLQVKTLETDGYYALQVGAGIGNLKKTSKAMMGHYAKANVPPKQKIVEFRVTPDALLPVGTQIKAQHFVAGQFVDVTGITKGKGFQGAVKRWGFAGGPASHGSSKFHRKLGSTGQRQDPGKVWKGKKMAGRMGGDRRTQYSLRVVKINIPSQLIHVKGCVPGAKGSWVEIRDAIKRPHVYPPPFPTYSRRRDGKPPDIWRWKFRDPFWYARTTDWELKWQEALKTMKSMQKKAEGESEDILNPFAPASEEDEKK